MKRLWSVLSFSFLVALSMNFLDSFFHLLASTTVHLDYVAVKFTIIFVSVLVVAWLSGMSFGNGLFTSIFGPGMFYIYYRMVSPTLDRSVFTLDENVGYILLHAAMLLFAYVVMFRFVMRKDIHWSDRALHTLIAIVSGGLGVFYLVVPHSLVQSWGLHLELSAPWLAFVGAMGVLVGGTAFVALLRKKKKASLLAHDASFAFIVASSAAVLGVGFYLFSQVGSTQFVELGTVLFTDIALVAAVGAFVFTSIFFVTRWIGRSVLIGLAASAGVSVVLLAYLLFTDWFLLGFAVLDALVHFLFIFVSYVIALKLGEGER